MTTQPLPQIHSLKPEPSRHLPTVLLALHLLLGLSVLLSLAAPLTAVALVATGQSEHVSILGTPWAEFHARSRFKVILLLLTASPLLTLALWLVWYVVGEARLGQLVTTTNVWALRVSGALLLLTGGRAAYRWWAQAQPHTLPEWHQALVGQFPTLPVLLPVLAALLLMGSHLLDERLKLRSLKGQRLSSGGDAA